MRNLQFSRYQLKRILKLNGSDYTFYREGLNDFNEPNGSSFLVITLRGIWSESSVYITLQGQEGAITQSKSSPQILTEVESIGDLKQGDFLTIGDTRYRVNGIENLSQLDVGVFISLEVEK